MKPNSYGICLRTRKPTIIGNEVTFQLTISVCPLFFGPWPTKSLTHDKTCCAHSNIHKSIKGNEEWRHCELTIPLREGFYNTLATMKQLVLLVTLFLGTSFAALIATEFPHLIIPLISTTPDTAYGTQYDATISYAVHISPSASSTHHTDKSSPAPAQQNSLKSRLMSPPTTQQQPAA